MSQSPVRRPDPGQGPEPDAGRLDLLDRLAAQAVRRVADRVRGGRDDPDAAAQERLHAAATDRDRRSCVEVARALMADGHRAERICDVHIPGAVRRMGEEWVSGELSFATVTIGSARLQRLLRELDALVPARPDGPAEAALGAAGAVLLVVPPGADHTLGAVLLASQLRRRGVAVRLSLGEPPEAVGAEAARTRFDAVFLSAAIPRSLPDLGRVAVAIRQAAPDAPPVVLGGVAVAGGPAEGSRAIPDPVDLAAFDHVTGDLEEAMRLCGIGAAK